MLLEVNPTNSFQGACGGPHALRPHRASLPFQSSARRPHWGRRGPGCRSAARGSEEGPGAGESGVSVRDTVGNSWGATGPRQPGARAPRHMPHGLTTPRSQGQRHETGPTPASGCQGVWETLNRTQFNISRCCQGLRGRVSTRVALPTV